MTHRYTGVMPTKSKGDPAKTGRLRNRARILVQQLINRIKAPPFNGVGQQSRSWRGNNGEAIHVMVNMVGLAPIIRALVESPMGEIDEVLDVETYLYVESGLLLIPRYSDQAGVLYPTDATRMRYGYAEHALLDRLVSVPKFRSRNYSLPTLPSASVTAESTYYYGSTRGVAPYIHPGKMKLFLQARFNGRKWEGRSVEIQREDRVRNFLLDNVRFSDYLPVIMRKDHSITLYTEKPGRYYLIWFLNGDILYRKLYSVNADAVAAIVKFISTLQQNSLLYQRYEAYVLSDVDFRQSEDWVAIGSYDLVGETIAYGWKPNWKGDKIAIVVHERLKDAGVNLVFPPRAQYAEVTLEQNTDFDPSEPVSTSNAHLTASFVLVEEKEWTIGIKGKIFWPDYFGSAGIRSNRWYTKGSLEAHPTNPYSENTPLYCFYNYKDQLCVVRHTRIKASEHVPFDWSSWYSTQLEGLADAALNISHEETTEFDGDQFSLDVGDATGAGSYASITTDFSSITAGSVGTGREAYTVRHQVGGVIQESVGSCLRDYQGLGIPSLQTNWETTDEEECPWDPAFRSFVKARTHMFEWYYKHDIADGVQEDTAFVIPFGNAEACYFVNHKGTQQAASILHRTGEGIFSNIQPSSGITNWRNRADYSGTSGAGLVMSPETIMPDEGNTQWLTQTVTRYYVDRFGVETLEPSFREGSTLAGYPDGLDLLIAPPVELDTFDGWFASLPSVEGLKFYQIFPSQTNQEKNAVVSNFEHPLMFDAGYRQLFAGWQ